MLVASITRQIQSGTLPQSQKKHNKQYMAKITITFDDSKPEIVALFGANAVNAVLAQALGYMTMVEKTPEELPAKVDVQVVDQSTGETVTVQEYPAGTEMYKPNPETKTQFVARKTISDSLVPYLLQSFKQKIQEVKQTELANEIKQAQSVLESTATVEIIE